MTPYITEVLQDINTNPESLLTKYAKNASVEAVIRYAFDKNLKFLLPGGTPEFKKAAEPMGCTPTNFYQYVRKLYVFTRPEITDQRRQQLFVQWLEGVHPDEAEIYVLIKDQNLTKKYPNITPELVLKTGWVTQDNIFRASTTPTNETEGKTISLAVDEIVTTRDGIGDKPVESVVLEQQPVTVVEPPKKKGRPKK